jgi:quercetin dioxygenase-like cupin family protein
MAKLAIINERDVAESGYPELERWTTTGSMRVRDLSPQDYSLRLLVVDADPGANVSWDSHHGDEGLHVLSGELEVEGKACPAGGAIVIESGVRATVAARSATRFVHCSPRDLHAPTDGLYGPPAPDGHGVHVLGPAGWFASGKREGVTATWFCDSTCPTCRISFFVVAHGPGFAGNLHTHSQDEIIYVLEGDVALGPRRYGPGTAFNIPGNVAYRTSYPDGSTFLNFRRDVSEQRTGRGGVPVLEGALARDGWLVGDFVA